MEKFWQKVEFIPFHDCWEWSAHTHRGRGRMRIKGKNKFASRISWELAFGTIPASLFVLHKCDNPGCVRPDHLFLGTTMDNVRDKISKNRQRYSKGNDHYMTKIREENIEEVRRLRNDGWKLKALSAKFGVTVQTISNICTGLRR